MPLIRHRQPRLSGSVATSLLVVFLFLITGCVQDRDSWERIRESGVLRVGVDPTFPPFALAEGELVEGIDVDLARALGEAMGLEVQFSYFGYDGLYDALTTGQVDALVSALVIMPERTKDIAYSDAYFDAGQFLVAPAASGIDGMADLSGRALAVELGALGHVEALDWQSRLSRLEVQTHGSAADALAAVASGSANAALVDRVGGLLYLSEAAGDAAGLVMLDEPVVSEPYVIAVRIEDRILMEEINEALAGLKESERLEAIFDRWLDG